MNKMIRETDETIDLSPKFPRKRVALINAAIRRFMTYRHVMGYSEDRAMKLAMRDILEEA